MRRPFCRYLLLAVSVSASGACSDMCANEPVRRVDSPDGRRSAVLFQRDCGATTGFSTHVSVLGQGEEPSGGGNAFRADADHGAARTGRWGGSWAEVEWLAPDRLLIRYAARSRLFERDDEVSGVRISYRQVGR